VSSGRGPILDPQWSPDAAWIAYVQAGVVWVAPAEVGEPHPVTGGAGEAGVTHGLAEYIAQEEMGRSRGFWWSPDSQTIAFTEVDERHIPAYRIVHQGQPADHGAVPYEDHRYPFAGQANARVRLGVAGREGGAPVWMDLGQDEDIYLARVAWLPDGGLAAQVENRDQTALDLLKFDPATGQATRLLREESPVWINLHDVFHPIQAGRYAGCFLWAAERTGFRHLYLYSGEGELLRALTTGEWMVEDLAAVDETNGLAYFTATLDGPLECHLYAVSLDGITAPADCEPRRITTEAGMHGVVIDPACQRFIDTCSSAATAPHITLRALGDGRLIADLFTPEDPRLAALDLRPPELVTLRNRAGDRLYGALYRPDGAGPFPTIVSVYGGPHAQMVTNSWRTTTEMRAQYLRQAGFLVFTLDNRGSARRGLGFEGAIRHHLGDLEVQDQVDGVRWLVEQGLADPRRVGIYGWSYGGYMAAMCLMRAPETFQAAVAGAPVTHWDGYDTHYTERYMGTPQSNPDGYAESTPMRYVDQMRGRLMLVHGLIDENVHFRHTARLITALIQARKTYDLLLFPDERHTPRRQADRVYMEERIVDFFKKNL
jgi:dipeptidyl-peptidase-4